MCDLKRGKESEENMVILKIHGGITEEDIFLQVNKAIQISTENKRNGIDQTVLFFDEANTTSAISTIKTVMCDGFVGGIQIPHNIGLQFVAAVNPYRHHSEDMVAKLEAAGLGYHKKVSVIVCSFAVGLSLIHI